MKRITTLVALNLVALSALGASGVSLETELQRTGLTAGIQNPQCFGETYAVELVDGRINVQPAGSETKGGESSGTVAFAGRTVRYEAHNNGEFGGRLEAILKSGERRVMVKGNIHSLLPAGKDLYAFEGLDHLSMSTGLLYLVRDYDGDPRPPEAPVTFLPDTPVYAANARNRAGWLWVVGTRSLVMVIPDWHLLKVQSWNEFTVRSVSSLAEHERGILIGTCGGVIVIETPPCRDASALSTVCPARFYVPKKT